MVEHKAWQTIKPQLEETINLRREHAAAKFHDLRRHNRQDEMKGSFRTSVPSYRISQGIKLFLDVDLLELPVVKALLEENDCRTAVTDERWLLVQNTLVDAVRDHAKRIEDHCDRVIEDAKRNAIDLGKHRWYETECREWEKRQEEREAEREELGSDEDDVSIFDPHPDELEEPPDELYELEDEYCFDDDRDLRQEIEEDEDRMPSRLLSASSLFEQEINGVKKLTSYADILRRRASMPIPGFSLSSGEPVAWCKENISSSAEIVDTAVMLLKYLNLPVRTSMVYMSACGKVFCLQTLLSRPLKTGVTWPELVSISDCSCCMSLMYVERSDISFMKTNSLETCVKGTGMSSSPCYQCPSARKLPANETPTYLTKRSQYRDRRHTFAGVGRARVHAA